MVSGFLRSTRKERRATDLDLRVKLGHDSFPLKFGSCGEFAILRSPLGFGEDDRLKSLRERDEARAPKGQQRAGQPRPSRIPTSRGLKPAFFPTALSSLSTASRTAESLQMAAKSSCEPATRFFSLTSCLMLPSWGKMICDKPRGVRSRVEIG